MGRFVLGLITIVAVCSGSSLQHCCLKKTVGEHAYTLVGEEDTSVYHCKDDCVYERVGTPGKRVCFKSGELMVVCEDQGRDFSYHEGNLTFAEADAACQKEGKYLASIHSETENNLVGSLIPVQKQVWIGAFDYDEEGLFKWTDSSSFDYSNFYTSQPNGKENENCVVIRPSSFIPECWASKWFDRSCEVQTSYICAKKGPSKRDVKEENFQEKKIITPSDDGIIEKGIAINVRAGKTLKFHPELKTYQEAQKLCQDENGNLVSVHSKEDNDMVAEIVPASGEGFAWIGINDENVEGIWEWTDGSALNYTNWISDQPNGGPNENCVIIISDQKECLRSLWADRPCTAVYPFVCETS